MRLLLGSASLIAGHIRARIGRALYLILTTAVAAAALTDLAALMPERAPAAAATSSLFVANARDGSLPLRYAARIAEMPEVAGISYLDVLPVLCSAGRTATLNGFAGGDTAMMLQRDYGADATVLAAWNADPLGVLVGEKLARQCGWSLGMHPSPRNGMTGRETEIHIVGILRATIDRPFAESIAVAHYEYLDRLSDESGRDQVAGIIVRASDAVETGALAARLDERFAEADPPTETQQSGDAESGLRRFGRIQIVLAWVMAATYACFALVMVSLMGHAAAERRAMFSVLRALGFPRRFLLGCFVAEFAALTVTGIALGGVAGLAFIARYAPVFEAIIGAFAAPAWIWRALPLAFASALIAGLLIPAAVVARVRSAGRTG